jgi:hypothetical protein
MEVNTSTKSLMHQMLFVVQKFPDDDNNKSRVFHNCNMKYQLL